MPARFMVAIDLSKYKHTASLIDTHSGQICRSLTFPVNATGFATLEQLLHSYSPQPHDFVIGCEATGHYGETLLRRLQQQSYPIVRLNPAQVAQFRRGLGRKAKTDVVDAIAMAKQLSVTDWQPEPELSQPLRQLRSLTRLRLDFVEEQSRWVNRIRAVINQIYPEIEPLLKDLTAATSLAVLTRYPSRQALATAGITELTDCVQKASRQNKGVEFAQQLQQTAAASVGLDDPCLAAELRLMLCQLQSLLANIHALEQELRHYTELVLHSYSTRLGLTKPLNLKSFPYGNYVTLATLLAELGDVQRFPTLKHLLSYLGWCPNTHESGLSQVAHPRMSHRGNRFARRIVWLMSVGAVRWVAEYRAYFQQRVAGGKNKMKTLVAIGRKLLSVFYAVLKTGRPYETQRYLERPALPIAT